MEVLKNNRFSKGHIPWSKGKIFSLEYRQKLSDAHKGQKVVHSEETKRKISDSHKGLKPSNETRIKISEGHKGQIAWNKGINLSEEHKKNLSEAHKGYKYPEEVRLRMGLSRIGEKNHNWKGGVTPEAEKVRKSIEYRLWREAVFARDNWTCQMCGKRGNGELNAHHIKPFSDCPEFRTSIENGITLCRECHIEIHKGKG